MNVEATARLFALGTDTGPRGERWCYLAGPMRSKPGHNYEAFNAAAKTLRDYGWHVFNPAETDAEVRTEAENASNPLSVYMQQDLVDVCKSDVVFVLSDWGESEGARLEVTVASGLGIPVYAFPNIQKVDTALALELLAKINKEPTDFSRRVLDYVKPNGEAVAHREDKPPVAGWPVTDHKKFDHDKGHLVTASFGSPGPVGTVRPYIPGHDKILDSKGEPVTVREAINLPLYSTPPRQFSSGATRNPDTNKPDFEGFISPLVVEEFGRYMHEHRLQADGTLRSSDNWQKGISFESYMKSMWRHFQHVWLLHRGQKATDYDTGEPVTLIDALCGVKFNVDGYLLEALKVRQRRAFLSGEEFIASLDEPEGVDAVTRTG